MGHAALTKCPPALCGRNFVPDPSRPPGSREHPAEPCGRAAGEAHGGRAAGKWARERRAGAAQTRELAEGTPAVTKSREVDKVVT